MWAAEAIAKKDIPRKKFAPVKKGEKITITRGVDFKYALWRECIWDLPEEYVDEKSIKIICE